MTWPTASGITEDEARAACSGQINGTDLFSQCSPLLNDTFDFDIESCVEDTGVSN